MIKLTKAVYQFENGSQSSGIVVTLAPKMSKFFSMENPNSSDNLDLLKTFNPSIYNWYLDSNAGSYINWTSEEENSYTRVLNGEQSDD